MYATRNPENCLSLGRFLKVMPMVFFVFCGACDAESDPCAPPTAIGLSSPEEKMTLCQQEVFSPVNITTPVNSFNITALELDRVLSFTCEAFGSGNLSVEWSLFSENGTIVLPLSDLGTDVVTQNGQHSVCSNFSLLAAALYEQRVAPPVVVVCNVTQKSILRPGEIHYAISEGRIFLTTLDPRPVPPLLAPDSSLVPKGLELTPTVSPRPTIEPPPEPSFRSEGAIIAGSVLPFAALLIACCTGLFFAWYKQRTKHRRICASKEDVPVQDKPMELQHTCVYPTAFLPLTKPWQSTKVATGDVMQPIHNTSRYSSVFPSKDNVSDQVDDVIYERHQQAAAGECDFEDITLPEGHVSPFHGCQDLEVNEAPPAFARNPQEVECTLPSCKCQESRCKYYESVYTSETASTSQKQARTCTESISTISLASIANDECFMRGVPQTPSSPTGTSNISPQTTDALQEIEPCGLCSSSVSSVPFQGPMAFIKCDSSGGVYNDSANDFSITIPKGAVPEGVTVTMEIGVTLHGPFHFPTNLKPVSPVLWICVRNQEAFEFQIPVQIRLPHYLHITGQEDLSRLELTFLKANHVISDESSYTFTQADGITAFEVQSAHGVLSTKHFCFLCIAANLSPEDTGSVNLSLVHVQPCPIETSSWTVYFCVTYFLQTCIETVKRQYPRGHKVTTKKFRFIEFGEEARLHIDFSRQIAGGWTLALGSDNKICASEVDFWSIERKELDLMHRLLMYPPRFSVEIAAEHLARNTTADFHFSGAHENLDVQLILKPPNMTVAGPVAHRMLGLSPSTISLPTITNPTPQPCITYPYMLVSPDELQMDCIARQLPAWGSYSSLPEDYPTNEELDKVTSEVMGRLQHDWIKLQAYLNVPDDAMLELHSQPTLRRKVYCMLRMWRDRSQDGNRARLADCLKAADQRLHKAANRLLAGEYQTLSVTPTSSTRSGSISSGSSVTRGAILWPLHSTESLV